MFIIQVYGPTIAREEAHPERAQPYPATTTSVLKIRRHTQNQEVIYIQANCR